MLDRIQTFNGAFSPLPRTLCGTDSKMTPAGVNWKRWLSVVGFLGLQKRHNFDWIHEDLEISILQLYSFTAKKKEPGLLKVGRFQDRYCLWFRNPKQPPVECIKPCKKMGYLPYQAGFFHQQYERWSTDGVSWNVRRKDGKTAQCHSDTVVHFQSLLGMCITQRDLRSIILNLHY